MVNAGADVADQPLTAEEVAAKQTRRNRIQAIVAVAVVLLVFGVLLPQLIDYGQVWEAMKQLTIGQLLVLALLATLGGLLVITVLL